MNLTQIKNAIAQEFPGYQIKPDFDNLTIELPTDNNVYVTADTNGDIQVEDDHEPYFVAFDQNAILDYIKEKSRLTHIDVEYIQELDPHSINGFECCNVHELFQKLNTIIKNDSGSLYLGLTGTIGKDLRLVRKVYGDVPKLNVMDEIQQLKAQILNLERQLVRNQCR
jgi:hypothetical protein